MDLGKEKKPECKESKTNKTGSKRAELCNEKDKPGYAQSTTDRKNNEPRLCTPQVDNAEFERVTACTNISRSK